MAFLLGDRIRETSTAPGTGSFTVNGAVQGARTFASVLTTNADTTWYAATNGTAWETGLLTRTSASVYARTTIFASSNAGSVVNFTSGTVDVFCDLPASRWATKADLASPSFTGIVTTEGQIKFPAAQNPSSNVNTLDDYEEGTATLSLTFGGASTSITYDNQIVDYTKIGRLVTLIGYLTLTNKGSATGVAMWDGLPFPVAGTGTALPCPPCHAINMNTITVDPVIQLVGGVSTFWLKAQLADDNLDNTHFSNTTSLRFSFSYNTTT